MLVRRRSSSMLRPNRPLASSGCAALMFDASLEAPAHGLMNMDLQFALRFCRSCRVAVMESPMVVDSWWTRSATSQWRH